jgi:hypothetical protein
MKKLVVVLVVIMMLLAGCKGSSSTGQAQQRAQEVQHSDPVYAVQNHVERDNIQRRLKIFDNPAQVSWIYCLADNGQIVFYGSVLGKVTSSGKRLEPKEMAGCTGDYCGSNEAFAYDGDWVIERMQADGTFGSSDAYVYWFDPDGNYYQWGGYYFLTSVPIKINESVLNIRDVSEDE